MPKNFEINRTKIKGGCQLGRKVVTHNSKSDLPLVIIQNLDVAALAPMISGNSVVTLILSLMCIIKILD